MRDHRGWSVEQYNYPGFSSNKFLNPDSVRSKYTVSDQGSIRMLANFAPLIFQAFHFATAPETPLRG